MRTFGIHLAASLLILVAAGIAAGVAVQTPSNAPAAEAATAAFLQFPNVTCLGNLSTASFAWTPVAEAEQQWLDVSNVDNNFRPGTFEGLQVDAAQSTHTLTNLDAGVPVFWRVNSLYAGEWTPSPTGTFVPCGRPALLWGPVRCTARGLALAEFRWSPAGGNFVAQWIDLGMDPRFTPGSFVATGPLDPTLDGYRWNSIEASQAGEYHFRVNALSETGDWQPSSVGTFSLNCAPEVRAGLYSSGDTLEMPRLGLKAPVNVRDVDDSGFLGNPNGAWDVVRYNFPLYPDIGGYPGNGGTTMIAGHVDYYVVGLAIFHPLRSVQQGDVIRYRRGDGHVVIYEVDWYADLPPESDWTSLARYSEPESIVLITCNGDFNFATRTYSHRRVVHGTLVEIQ